jgi:type II secretory pathway component PulJ
MRARGFSLLELTISLAGFAIVFGVIAAGMLQDTQTHRALVSQSVPQMRLNDALERITTDLRMAGIWGEDRNRDGDFNAGEDLNGNGVLDSDWSFPKTTAAAIEPMDSIAFNIRRDDIDPDTGTIVATGIYSTRVAYRLVGDDLIRETTAFDGAGKPVATRAVIASGVSELRFVYEPGASGTMIDPEGGEVLPANTYDGGLVRVRVSCDIPQPGGGVQRRTQTASVWLRN